MINFKVKISNRMNRNSETVNIEADSFVEMTVKARDFAIRNQIETIRDTVQIAVIERNDGKALYSE